MGNLVYSNKPTTTDTGNLIKPTCKDPGILSILSYNTLAVAYAQYHDFCPEEFLDFDYRKNLLSLQLQKINSEFVCLQEIDRYSEYFQPLLESLEYSSHYYKRPSNFHPDGSVLAWKSDNWKLIKFEELDYNSLPKCKENSAYRKYNIGILGVFQEKATGKFIIIGTSHFHWNPDLEYVKFLQGKTFSFEAARLRSEYNCPVILTGDFNSEPNSTIIKYLRGQELKLSEGCDIDNEILTMVEKIPIELKSAYSNYSDQGHPKFTNYTRDYKGCLDYILHTHELEVKELGKVPSYEDFCGLVGIPNHEYPSDHLPIVANFLF